MSSMHGLAGPPMSRPTGHELPKGYPAAPEWVRTEDLEFGGRSIRMTVTPGDRIVELWELSEGRPVQWLGNVFRVDSEPPCVYLNHTYERHLPPAERAALARIGARFWKS
jgi:hypothetical protein